MVRPRRLDDDALLERVADALQQRSSLTPWTLAEIAGQVGLSPAGLLKPFGSRRGVLLALSRRWIDSVPVALVGQQPAEDELRAWASQRFAHAGTHGVARGLVDLLGDLADEELRAHLAEGWAKEMTYLAALLHQMNPPRLNDANRGARLLFDALNGAMFRHAARLPPLTPTSVLDDFLETWT